MAPAGYVNIRRDVDDKFYRYRMPILLTKIEGKGNGIKTVVPNMADVARALTRPASYPTKFFGCELGAQTTFDDKTERYIVNGAHDATRLRELLDSFIDKFVLCGECKNPETELIITKNDDIIRDCKACGQRTSVDMRHKLTTFILKNPPKKTKTKGKTADAGNTAGPRVPDSPKNGSDNDKGSDDDMSKRFKADASDLPSPTNGDELATDTSPEAVRARMKGLTAGLQSSLVIADGDDSDGEDANSPYTVLMHWLEENRDSTSAVEVFKKIDELGIAKKHKAVQVCAQYLYTDKILSELEQFMPLFKKLTTSEKHEKSLLGGTERFLGIDHPDLIPSLPKILMEYYQADILEEELVKQWGTHVSKKYVDRDVSKKVRKASEPFLKWLDEADDDEDSEGDEE